MNKATPTLKGLRKKVTPFQKKLLQLAWQQFKKDATWPIVRKLYSDFGRQRVRNALSPLGGGIGREERSTTRWSTYQLSLIGVLLTDEGPALEALFEKFFEYQRDLFQKHPTKDLSGSPEIAKALNLNADETVDLGLLLSLGRFGGSLKGDWAVSSMDEAELFPKKGTLFAELEEWLLKYYDQNAPVFIDEQLRAHRPLPLPAFNEMPTLGFQAVTAEIHPPEISTSFNQLRRRYPDGTKLGFLIMRFADGKPFERIVGAIKNTAEKYGLAIVRADEVQFHEDVFGNVRTLLHGCSFGIAIYERIETEVVNANIGLEVGYLMAMNKPVLLLKDKNIKTLQADLAGKLYREFNPNEPEKTIPRQVTAWLKDNGIIITKRS